jgi:hypothetical protein
VQKDEGPGVTGAFSNDGRYLKNQEELNNYAGLSQNEQRQI